MLFSEYIYFTAFVVCINLPLMQFDKFSYIVIRSLGLYLFSFFLFFFCLFVLFFFFFSSKNSEVFSYFQSYAAEYHEFSQGLLNALFTTEGIVHGIVAHLK